MKHTAVLLALLPAMAGAQFALKNGDRVVFYGDSITDQRLYTLYTEAYVRTRFPRLNVSFVDSGWGGDRVTGGGGGDVDTRLTRDVLAYHPTVLLKSWNAPRLVSKVEIDAGKLVGSENTKVSNLNATPTGISWTQKDESLPFPLDTRNVSLRLVIDSSDFVDALDQQIVRVSGLSEKYNLAIDGKTVGTYSAEDLATGVNLATLDTPMKAQATHVLNLVRDRVEAHNQRWRTFQTGRFGTETGASGEKAEVMKALDRYDGALDKEARKAAEPEPHAFTLTPAN